MKSITMRSISLILAFVMCVGMLFGINLTANAASVDYVYAGNYIKNWGTREEVATFLSQNAIAFYEDNDTSYAELTELLGSSNISSVPSSQLYQELQDLMESNHSYVTSYDATRDKFQYTDCQNSGKTSSKISSFYSGKDIGPSWDSGKTWNREHTWPNSKGDMSGNGENDIMMLRPSASSENSSRGNKAYGTTTTSDYFNPNQYADGKYDLRGDVARIVLYQYVRWGCTNTGSKYNPDSIFGADGVIESKEILLEWIEEDPVDTWELGRNDSVESITGTRNVFVDYPELAFDLFDEQIPDNYTTPSGYYTDGETPDNNGNGSTGDDTPVDPDVPEAPAFVVVDAPVADTAYKFGMVQSNLGKTLYINGEMANTYYFGTTEDAAKAIDVYLEETEGGYYLTTTIGDAKKYINVVASGTYINAKYEDAASSVYTLDTEGKMVVTNVNGTEYALGTYNTFDTVSPNKTSYTDDFWCWFYASATQEPIDPDQGGDSSDNDNNELYGSWEISVTKTGIYTLTPTSNYKGNASAEKIAVLDKQSNEVKYNEKSGGYPLVADQNYTIKFKYNYEDDAVGSFYWTKKNISDTIFSDVSKNEWYNDAITYSVGRGLISGYGGTNNFGPADNIQRQDFLVILARLDGVDLTEYGNQKSSFPDVPEGSYYEAAINWGAKNGIVTGYQNGKFGVGDKITREQLVTFLHRYAEYKGLDVSYTTAEKNKVKNTYTDYKKVTDYAVDPVVWAVTNGVINGKTSSTIVPSGNALRCEVAQIMYNIFLNDTFNS